ncbi:MAG: response regulator [Candidatus Omnitrophica bacterium]|nr:response regulator [Candidatus Omnitrophota bacterium]
MEQDKKKIIVAEDSRELCDLLKCILEGEGYAVDFVHDGFSLIKYLKQTQDVDVIILDLIMPDKGGISIFDTIRSVAPASRLIIYTGYTSYRHSVFAREADAFINKTEGPEKLIETLRELLEG